MTNSKFSSQNPGEIDFQMSEVKVTIKSVFCDLIEKTTPNALMIYSW